MACGSHEHKHEQKEGGNCGASACGSEGKKCCAKKLICKLTAILIIGSFLYLQCQLLKEVKELNDSIDDIATYLDLIKSDSAEMKNTSQVMKEQIQELKKDDAAEANNSEEK